MPDLTLRPADECRYDAVSLGEVMLRLDPGRGPHPHRAQRSRSGRAAASTTSPAACAGASACETAVVTAFADNEVGPPARGFHPRRAAWTPSFIQWVPYDGIGRTVRNGLNFTERGFGVRGAVGISDRGHTAASPAASRATSTGTTSSASSACAGSTPAASSPRSVRHHRRNSSSRPSRRPSKHGTVVTYDLNYRPSLWKRIGGQASAPRR